ncbi:uncharacterized protein LOC117160377 [Bombus vancouverensis nearcticus]|uniref:uncharacterized protein LOC117160377 n=1 Tax=Bombus vancouverensis nearcticus TaxID=2705178 RepID=UPI001438AB16|nr:uncharacterized protein LOC117160377 [Bombus vancouverensis nearcticus]
MNTSKRMKLIYLVLVVLNSVRNVRMNGESSGEYLQKVMFQLQEFNVPSPTNIYDRRLSNNGYKNVIYMNKDRQNYQVQKINMNTQRNTQKYQNHSFQHHNTILNEKVDLHPTDLSFSQYHEPHIPIVTKVKNPEVLGFTRAELAAMYKSALEKGSTISLSSLTNALSSGEVPQITQTHVEFPIKQPLYQYYFFPLKTFMSEFKKDRGYKTIPAHAYDKTEAAQTTQTQLSNPIFVAISTFVTMAIVFMMSVLFLPKITQLEIFPARSIQDDFFYLTNIVTNAIERYNLLEKFRDHHVNTIR